MIYRVSNPYKWNSVTVDESDYESWNKWHEHVKAIKEKLKWGIFVDRNGEYFKARYKVVNLSVDDACDATHSITRVKSCVKFKWFYQPIREDDVHQNIEW